MKTKTFRGVKSVDEAQGIVRAVFATLNVIDHDGDVTLPGAFKQGQAVRISAFEHGSWGGLLPVGRGTISEEGDEAIVEAQFFMNTDHGRNTFHTVKGLGDLAEWSYGYETIESEAGQLGGQDVRFLKEQNVIEVSPVLLGAGIDTRTLDAKGLKSAIPAHSTETVEGEWDAGAALKACPENAKALRAICAWVDPEGNPDSKASYKFPHHAEPGAPANLTACSSGIAVLNGGRGGTVIPDVDREGVYAHLAKHLKDGDREPPELASKSLAFADEGTHALVAVEAFTLRAKSLADLRRKEGRVLSAANRDKLSALLVAIGDAQGALRSLLEETDKPGNADEGKAVQDVGRELLRFTRTEQAIAGGAA